MLICGVRGILFLWNWQRKKKMGRDLPSFISVCMHLSHVIFCFLHFAWNKRVNVFYRPLSHEIRELIFYRPPWPFPARPCPWEESHGTTGPNPGVVDRSGWSERFSLASKYRTRLMFATTPAQPCASIVRSFYAACSDRDCSVKVCLHRSFIQL